MGGNMSILNRLGRWVLVFGAALVGQFSQAQALPSVEFKTLAAVQIHPQREASATMLARNESRLSAEVGGSLVRWTADTGAQVKRGELLAQIDPTDYQLALQRSQAALEAAQARHKLAQSQLARARDLVAQGFYSAEALSQRETETQLAAAELASSQSQLASARRQLEKTSLLAPFAANVRQRLAQVGETVAPGNVLYVLVQAGEPELSAALAVADVAGLRSADQPVFETQGQRCPVRLLRVADTISAPARTREVRLTLQVNAAPACSSVGADGRLLWLDSRPHVPAALMVRRGPALGVFVKNGATVRFVALPGAQEGHATAVNLPADTLLVVRGQAALQDGQALK